MTGARPYPFRRPSALGIPVEIDGVHDRPLIPVVLPSGDEAVLVTRYADVRQLLADDRLSRNLNRPGAARISRNNRMFQDPGIDPDPPEHTRIRRLVVRAFTGARVEQLKPAIAAIVDELLDAMAAAGGPVDLNEALAFPLPIRVVCELLGVPGEDVALFRHWTDTFFSVSKFSVEQIRQSMTDMSAYMARLIAARRQEPAEDLVSAMIRVTDSDDGRLSEHELHWWCRLLLLVGYETTATQLGGSVAMLLEHPEHFRALRHDPSRIPAAIEELLRWKIVGSSLSMLRYATDDIELDGGTIPKGTSVIPGVDCANQDPSVFANPRVFDPAREKNPHLTFSLGAHHCIGANLARAELCIAVESLLRRFPSLRLVVPANELRRHEGALLEGFAEIPVTW